MDDIRRVGVVGAGLMGSGIAQVAAQAGFQVVLRDVGEGPLERSFQAIRKSLDYMQEKGKISPEQATEATGAYPGDGIPNRSRHGGRPGDRGDPGRSRS